MVEYYVAYRDRKSVKSLDEARKLAVAEGIKRYKSGDYRSQVPICKYEFGYLYTIGYVKVENYYTYGRYKDNGMFYYTPITYPGKSDFGKRGKTVRITKSGRIARDY